MTATPGFFERLSLALRVLGAPELAARVRDGAVSEMSAHQPTPQLPSAEPVRVIEERIVTRTDPEAGALWMLSMLQRDGRLIDFLLEDIATAADADVGAGARIVHNGCKKALSQYFTIEPVRSEREGTPIVVDKGFDAGQIRLAGNVSGEPPFHGTLAHPGWRAVDVRLPERASSVDARIIAPAEVEL